MSTVKQQLADVVAALPDDCTLDDFRYHLYLRQKMEASLRDIDEGRVHTPEEAAEIIKSWREPRDTKREASARESRESPGRHSLADASG